MFDRKPHWFRQPVPWMVAVVCFLLALGIVLRFANIEGKTYWVDEAYTLLRVAGYTEASVIEKAFDGEILSIADLQKYQFRDGTTSFADTLRSLAVESPQHPPFYYLMARVWLQIGFDSVRSLSAVVSLLVFPGMAWLCWELFRSRWVAMVGMALLAISPFHLLYAQEAREYSLWTGLLLLTHAAFLRSLRIPHWRNWGIYAGLLAVSFYTFPFSGFMAIAYTIFIFLQATPKKQIIHYCISTGTAIALFAPWIGIALQHWQQVQKTLAWTSQDTKITFLFDRWFLNLSRLFYDFGEGYENSHVSIILLLLVVFYSIYFLYRYTSPPTWQFVFLLIAMGGWPLMLSDLFLGGLRSVQARYLLPAYLGFQISVSYLLATQLQTTLSHPKHRGRWLAIALAFTLSGIGSCLAIVPAEFWWNKGPIKSKYNPEIAEIVNQANQPLLIADDSTRLSDSFACRMLALSHLLRPNVHLLLLREPNFPSLPTTKFDNIFMFSPAPWLLQAAQDRSHLNLQTVFHQRRFHLLKIRKVPGK